jgi:beta-barrel assembly-enhancing protease
MLRKPIAVLAVVLALLPGCQTNPVTGRSQVNFFSEEEEIEFGNRYANPLLEEMGGLYDDPELQALVEDVGRRLVEKLPSIAKEEYSSKIPVRFYVVNESMINAFALIGGHVYFTRGILAEFNSEDELAGVMGHEIMHLAGKHTASSISRDLLMAPLAVVPLLYALKSLHYSRKDEEQSDKYGLRLMVAAGYNPLGMAKVFEMFVRIGGGGGVEWLSSHPLSEDRVADAKRRATEQFPQAAAQPLQTQRFDRAVARLRAERPIYKSYDEGMALLEKKDYRGAIRKFGEAISRKEDPLFYLYRGWAYGELKEYDEAYDDATRATQLNSKLMKPWLLRGMVLQEAGQPEDAIRDLNEANARVESSVAHYYLGRCHEDRGRRRDARRGYVKCLELEGFVEDGVAKRPDEDAAEYVRDAYDRWMRLRD